MAPYAICPNLKCGLVFDFSESETEDARPSQIPPLLQCPKCGAKMVFYCERCFIAIHRIPTARKPFCLCCGTRLIGSPDGNAAAADSSDARRS